MTDRCLFSSFLPSNIHKHDDRTFRGPEYIFMARERMRERERDRKETVQLVIHSEKELLPDERESGGVSRGDSVIMKDPFHPVSI